jgi:hypothetical protein
MGWLIRDRCSTMLTVSYVSLIGYLPLNWSQMGGYCAVKLRAAYNHAQVIWDRWYYLLQVLLSRCIPKGIVYPQTRGPSLPRYPSRH